MQYKKSIKTPTLPNKTKRRTMIMMPIARVKKPRWLRLASPCWQSIASSTRNAHNRTSFESFLLQSSPVPEIYTHFCPKRFSSNLCYLEFLKSDFVYFSINVFECLNNFLSLTLSSRTSPFRKRLISFFGVGVPRTVCVFVCEVAREKRGKKGSAPEISSCAIYLWQKL